MGTGGWGHCCRRQMKNRFCHALTNETGKCIAPLGRAWTHATATGLEEDIDPSIDPRCSTNPWGRTARIDVRGSRL